MASEGRETGLFERLRRAFRPTLEELQQDLGEMDKKIALQQTEVDRRAKNEETALAARHFVSNDEQRDKRTYENLEIAHQSHAVGKDFLDRLKERRAKLIAKIETKK